MYSYSLHKYLLNTSPMQGFVQGLGDIKISETKKVPVLQKLKVFSMAEPSVQERTRKASS